MANPVQIVNLALSWMGQDLINALGDNQNEAKIMNANFALSRDKVLSDNAWTFAIRRQILTPDGTQPVFGFSNRFLIPSDVLTVHRVFRPQNIGATLFSQVAETVRGAHNADWIREGAFILAREETIHCIFIIRIENTDLFHPSFVHALAARLAADTAMTFTENEKLQTRMEDRYDAKLGEAQFSEGRQGRTERIVSNLLTGARTR